MAFKKEVASKTKFSKITISLSSPEAILARSYGEVTKPETINYRNYRPERDGLFCERIFGPTKDWQCQCGKYKRIRYKGIKCDHCGVEVTEKKVRRERSGHIQLIVPIAHIWYFKSNPNKISALLGIQSKKLLSVIYFEKYVVIQPGNIPDVEYAQLLTEDEYYNIMSNLPPEQQQMEDSNPEKFVAKMGSEALHEMLVKLDLDTLSYDLRDKASKETSGQRKSEYLKRLNVIEAFRDSKKKIGNRPEWMILSILPVIPPDLRPLVPLDGGRFAASDINDLYRRVIIRNNRLKRLIEMKAPDVILRNEKRMLQEAVDSLLDNAKKVSSIRSDSTRALKSLSDNLKGKQGRFRQNLLGKRVDYSGRSVIVVGPELHLNECGIPKDMAAELFKPFIIRKLLERGIVKTVKSAKKVVERKDSVIWDILENIMKGHPVLLNRAPTLHRLGIQAFQPKMIEGKAIRLHPLVCTAFNADFDGDQMAVHLPLSNAAILEAQLLMLASHNILNPANGAPVTVPSQDMVLGLYYLTKPRISTEKEKIKGEGQSFYGPEEVIIAFNEKRVDMHAKIKVRITDPTGVAKIIETTVGRVIFNEIVPKEYGFVNELLTKKSLRDIINDVLKKTGTATTAAFLDDIKDMGYRTAFKGGLSFNLGDVIVPTDKKEMIEEANEEVDDVMNSYNMGFITNNERYNQIIDIWTHTNSKLTNQVMKKLSSDNQGFNSVYMMLDSGARGSKEQIRQLCGMRGLMAKPQKSGAVGTEIIENPIISNFKEGLSVQEYFISTHGARKGLADTALKTADAGYLTRRLVDVAQDVIINEEDCGTLRGLVATTLKKGDDIVETLSERVLGRVVVNDVVNPLTGEVIAYAGEQMDEEKCKKVDNAPIEEIEIRSVLTCESKLGVCAKCYGRNLANGKMVQKGEAVGVIAAQSIGEPGTQLTLRTFHVGGVAGANVGTSSRVESKFNGILEIEELRSVPTTVTDDAGKEQKAEIVIGRSAELRILDEKTKVTLTTSHLPYGATLYVKNGSPVAVGTIIAEWDPYNAVIVSEAAGKVAFQNIVENVTFRVESDDATGYKDKVIIDTRLKSKNPSISIVDKDGNIIKTYDIPVGSRIAIEDKKQIKAGEVLVKIPRSFGKASDITGGLPRVTELFEARNASDTAVVAEIDGIVSFGKKLKRGNKEIIITSKTGEERVYLIPTSKQILAQENDFIKAGTPLSEGAVTPADILAIKGPQKVQEYIVNEVQEVYRLQGVKINDKHFEVIVRQMMRKMEILDPGDTVFLEGELVNKVDFKEENDRIHGMKVIVNAGGSETYKAGQIIASRELRDENASLIRNDKEIMEVRDAQNATGKQILQGITRAALQTKSFMSAASFQETTKVLTEAAVNGKTDELLGLKENVIIGHLIPAGTGLRDYDNLIVANKTTYATRMAMQDF